MPGSDTKDNKTSQTATASASTATAAAGTAVVPSSHAASASDSATAVVSASKYERIDSPEIDLGLFAPPPFSYNFTYSFSIRDSYYYLNSDVDRTGDWKLDITLKWKASDRPFWFTPEWRKDQLAVVEAKKQALLEKICHKKIEIQNIVNEEEDDAVVDDFVNEAKEEAYCIYGLQRLLEGKLSDESVDFWFSVDDEQKDENLVPNFYDASIELLKMASAPYNSFYKLILQCDHFDNLLERLVEHKIKCKYLVLPPYGPMDPIQLNVNTIQQMGLIGVEITPSHQENFDHLNENYHDGKGSYHFVSVGFECLYPLVFPKSIIEKNKLLELHFSCSDSLYLLDIHLVAALRQITTLTSLGFNRHLSDEEFAAIEPMLYANLDLKYLDLSRNSLTEESAPLIAKLLRQNDSLCVLNISKNAWGGAGLKIIADALLPNRNLTDLNVTHPYPCDEDRQSYNEADRSDTPYGLDSLLEKLKQPELQLRTIFFTIPNNAKKRAGTVYSYNANARQGATFGVEDHADFLLGCPEMFSEVNGVTYYNFLLFEDVFRFNQQLVMRTNFDFFNVDFSGVGLKNDLSEHLFNLNKLNQRTQAKLEYNWGRVAFLIAFMRANKDNKELEQISIIMFADIVSEAAGLLQPLIAATRNIDPLNVVTCFFENATTKRDAVAAGKNPIPDCLGAVRVYDPLFSALPAYMARDSLAMRKAETKMTDTATRLTKTTAGSDGAPRLPASASASGSVVMEIVTSKSGVAGIVVSDIARNLCDTQSESGSVLGKRKTL